MNLAVLERGAVSALMKLPAVVLEKAALALETHSRPQLDPRLRFLLALSEAKPALNTLSVPQARQAYREMLALLDGPVKKLARVDDHRAPVADGDILVRQYRPAGTAMPSPAILFFHGGGFTVGGVAEYDRLCRYIAHRTGTVVLSADYRLAPEHPAPVAADDAVATWHWLLDNAAELGLDKTRLAVMGDSAGANLSAVVSQQAKAAGLTLPALQVLIYPTTDGAMAHPSIAQLGEGFGLDKSLLHWFHNQYVQDPAWIEDYRISPLRNPDLSGLPETLLVTATDPLRDEGLEYGENLRAAGVTVAVQDYPSLIHGFISMGGAIPAARRAVDRLCDATAKRL